MLSSLQVNWATYKKTLKLTVFNALVTSSLFQVLLYPLSVRRVDCALPLPSPSKVLWDLFICSVSVEILFYYTHRYLPHTLDVTPP